MSATLTALEDAALEAQLATAEAAVAWAYADGPRARAKAAEKLHRAALAYVAAADAAWAKDESENKAE